MLAALGAVSIDGSRKFREREEVGDALLILDVILSRVIWVDG